MARVAVSWSGGKDSCLAMHRLIEAGHEIACLVSMISEEHQRSRSHAVPLPWMRLQAEALGVPILLVDSATAYGERLAAGLKEAKERYGATAVAFGTIYVERDRGWNEGIAMAVGLEPLFPVWTDERRVSYLLSEWINLGYEAVVCRALQVAFDRSWAGRRVDYSFYHDVHQAAVCPLGEYGEYHTFVLDGPYFRRRLEIVRSEVVLQSGLWSLDIQECRLSEAQQRPAG